MHTYIYAYVCTYICIYKYTHRYACTHAHGRRIQAQLSTCTHACQKPNPVPGRGWAANRGCMQRRNNPQCVGGCSGKKNKTELTNAHTVTHTHVDKQPSRLTRIMCSRRRGSVSGRQHIHGKS